MPIAPPPAPAARRDRLVLGGVFLLSGASALLFETLWFHLAGLVSAWASMPARWCYRVSWADWRSAMR